MKKVIASILMIILLAGCSGSNTNLQPGASGSITELTASDEGIPQQNPPSQTQIQQKPAALQPSETAKQSPNEEGWFAGCIGNAKVHAKFDFSGNEVTGVYYYDQYKKDIDLKGYINDKYELNMKDCLIITLDEGTAKKGEIRGVYKTEGYIEGYWKSNKDIYPVYLIKEGSGITPPIKPGTDTMEFAGHWTGRNSGYFGGSEADITPLFEDLIYYDLSAYSGASSGELGSFGIQDKNVFKSVFTDQTYDEKKENVFFEFQRGGNFLKLNSNMYDYMCGMGVYFDSEYVKGKLDIPVPTALEVGIVDTREQDELFRKLVGDRYNEFISYTSFVSYSEVLLDGKEVQAGNSILRGLSGYCSYIISPEHIYAAIIGDDSIDYYTNDEAYSKKLPGPIADWAANIIDMKITYNYKE